MNNTHLARLAILLGALTLGACATQSASTSATPATPAVAAAPAPATPAPVVATPVAVTASIDFDKQVKPFFQEYCYRCHSGQRVRGNVHVDTAAGLGRIAGTAERSRLYDALTAAEDGHMPPEGADQPSAADIAMIKQWIAEGAKVSADYPTGAAAPQGGGYGG